MSLTAFSVQSLPIPAKGQKAYYDPSLKGFGVRVSHSGTRTFILQYGTKNNRQRHTIGRVGIITLADARTEARRFLAERTLGQNKPKTMTYSAALEAFEEQKYPSLKERTRHDYNGVFKRHFIKRLGDSRLADITFEDVTAITDKLVRTPTEQKHALVVCNTFFRWCVRRRLLKHSPLDGVDIPKPPARKRVLNDAELVKVYRAAAQQPYPYNTIVRLLILTGQRRGEISALRPDWYSSSEKTVTLPEGFAKNKREHVIPLGPVASSLLAEATVTDGHYFPSGRKEREVFTGFSKAKILLDKELPGVAPWTLHDLRRTFSTNLAKLGVLPHIKEMLLNHLTAKTEVEAIYDTYKYLPEMRAAMEKWEAHVAGLLTFTTTLDRAA